MEKTIHIKEQLDKPILVEGFGKVRIVVNEGLNAEVVHHKTNENDVSIELGKNSKLDYYAIQNINENNKSIGLAELGENSILNMVQTDFGNVETLNEFRVMLNGKNAKANVINIFHGRNESKSEIRTIAEHVAEETKSNLYARGIITNKAKNTYKGLVKIHKAAKNSEGHQESSTLTFEDAEAYAIPELEIDNNEVACSHGSSVGRVDEEKIFYLTSRGLSEEEANQLIIKGFYEPVLVKISKEDVRDRIRKLIEERI